MNTNYLRQLLNIIRGELPASTESTVSTIGALAAADSIPRQDNALRSSSPELAIRLKSNVSELKKIITPEKQGQLNKELIQACVDGNTDKAVRLLQEGASPMAIDSDGDNALHTASMFGCMPIVRAIINHGVDVNSAGRGGYTALHWACQNAHDDIIQYLVTHGAYIDAIDKDGQTPLFRATIEGNCHTVVTVLSRGAKVNHQDKTGSTPLHYVVEKNDDEFTQITASLLVSNADPGIHDKGNYMPLHRAAASNCPGHIQLLLLKGANIEEIGGKHGTTPLHKACWEGSLEAVVSLLGNGANIRAKSGYDDNLPIHIAARKNFTEIGTEILSRDEDCICEKDVDGWTPLHIAARWNSVDFARLLISKGANPCVRNKASKTARDLTLPIVQHSMRKLLEKAEGAIPRLNRSKDIYL